jgi:hypothetical protein
MAAPEAKTSLPASDRSTSLLAVTKRPRKTTRESEPLLVETKKVRPSIPSDLLRTIEEKSRRERLRSPPPPQASKPGHGTGRTSGQAGRKTGAEKKAQKHRVKMAIENDDTENEIVGSTIPKTAAAFLLQDGAKLNNFASRPPSAEGTGQVHEDDESEDLDVGASDVDERDDDDNARALKKKKSELTLKKLESDLDKINDQNYMSFEHFERFVAPFLNEKDALDNLDKIVTSMPSKLIHWIAYGVGELGDMENSNERVEKVVRATRKVVGDPREDHLVRHDDDDDDDNNDDDTDAWWSRGGASGRHKDNALPPQGEVKKVKSFDPFTKDDEFDAMLLNIEDIDTLMDIYNSIHESILDDPIVKDKVNQARRVRQLQAARDRRTLAISALMKRAITEKNESKTAKRLKAHEEQLTDEFRKHKQDFDEQTQKHRVEQSTLEFKLRAAEKKNTGATSRVLPSISRRAADHKAGAAGERTPH